MLNKNLKVKIPKKFKKQLIARFSVSKAKTQQFVFNNSVETEYVINVSCPLCNYFKDDWGCGLCPFNKFSIGGVSGCFLWFRKVLNLYICDIITLESKCIRWDLKHNKQARKLLKKLKTQAKKYIEWV